MSFIAKLGGTGVAPSALRMGAVGLASYGALTWVGNTYGIDILQATPHRILAAGVIAVASEFALRQFSPADLMHEHNLRQSLRALQKDLKKPENFGAVAEILRTDGGFDIDEAGFKSLVEGRFSGIDSELLDNPFVSVEATKHMLTSVIEVPAKQAEALKSLSEASNDNRESLTQLKTSTDATSSSTIQALTALTETLKSLQLMPVEESPEESSDDNSHTLSEEEYEAYQEYVKAKAKLKKPGARGKKAAS